MTQSATPTQLSANNMAATESVDLPPAASTGPLTSALQALAAGTETALNHIDPHGADGGTIELLAEWHDEMSALKVDIWVMLHAVGSDTPAHAGFVEGLRDVLGGYGLKAMVADGTRLLDRLRDTIDALANHEGAAMLERHRPQVVALVNSAQQRLDS